jgi:hypothetical protein
MNDDREGSEEWAIAQVLDDVIRRLEKRGHYFVAAHISSALDHLLSLDIGDPGDMI